MLHAILHAKVRSQFSSIQDGAGWRKAYCGYEDFLTAAVVGRLSYLPSDVLWGVIGAASAFPLSIPYAGNLENITYWPLWNSPDEVEGERKEPDAFLAFEEVDVILEAKVDDGHRQSVSQWTDELLTFRKFRLDEGLREKPILLWALGGMGESPTGAEIEHFRTQLQKDCSDMNGISIAVTPWKSILNVISKLRRAYQLRGDSLPSGFSCYSNRHLLRILDDIINALRLHGIREWHFLSTLPNYWGESSISESSLTYFNNRIG